MTKVSDIHSDFLKQLSGIYFHAQLYFGVNPTAVSERKQKKIRKWICKYYKDVIEDLPQDIADMFGSKTSDKEALSFLQECYEQMQIYFDEKNEEFEKFSINLDEKIKSAIGKLLQSECLPSFKQQDNNLEIVIEDTYSYRRTLILQDVDGVPLDKEGCFMSNSGLLWKEEENKYCIYGELEDLIEESIVPFELTFADADVKVEVFDCIAGVTFWNNPWAYLQEIASAIYEKADLPGTYCNEAEIALLPLIREIAELDDWVTPKNQKKQDFIQWKGLADKYGYDKIVKLFTELEDELPGSDIYQRMIQKIIILLCEQKCEPMWREIFDKIKASQTEYPKKTEMHCPSKLLCDTRAKIQKYMEEQGYTGCYPDFVKNGSMKNIHLAESYGMTYFVGREKRVQYYVHCIESLEEKEHLTVQFLSGTSFLKKKEEVKDIYGCLFNAKGRRLFHTMHYDVSVVETVENSDAEDMLTSVDMVKEASCTLEESVVIAAKKAELMKLTKEERKVYYGYTDAGWKLFLFVFLFAGGLFGVFMTLGMMLVAVFMTIIFGQGYIIPEVITDIPWWLCLVISWAAYGGVMGAITVMVRRK